MRLRESLRLAPALLLAACAAAPDPADLIVLDARVYTLDWPDPARDGTPHQDAPFDGGEWHPDAEAVAIRGGRIVFVGSSQEARRWEGESSEVLEVGGATVLPGLIDSHVHIAGLGAALEEVDLVGVETEEEAVARVAERAQDVPPGEWIVGWGWDEGAWADRYPDMELLSERVPDHPVYLKGLHGFAVWGNRMAFERAGIDAASEDPGGGEIVRGERGRPTGILLNRARALLESALPPAGPEKLRQRVLKGLEEMAKAGYTAVHEAGAGAELIEAFQSLADEGRLPMRVYAMLSARDAELLDSWLEGGADRDASDNLAVRSVKAYYDGALGSRGARLLEDYSDRPGHKGVSGSEYGFDRERVSAMMKAGFQAAIHAIGDAANRDVLDFIEGVREESPEARAGRHRIEHAQVLHPDDIPRFAQLGVIASMQPPHAVEDKAWAEDRLGPERIRGAYAWRSLRESGARVIFNSDLPGSDHDFFYGLHAAATRRGKDRQPPEGWYPEESFTVEEAIRAYTAWPAQAEFAGQRTGIISPGREANLTILDTDPFTTAPDKLLGGRVLHTVIQGTVIR